MIQVRGAKSVSDFRHGPAEEPKGSGVSIGPGIGFNGTIEGADTLHVETSVELSVKCRVLVVMEGGHYRGSVEAEVVEVRGHFDGELLSKRRLVVHDKAVVSGTIRYRQIEVAQGATLSGSFEVLPPS
ncbi:MAG TPA: polymer-forming cytoskeletal protein [Alphaproteobacteria bacterium]